MNIKNNYKKYLKYLKSNLTLALGCTEPVAIALAVATAYENIKGIDRLILQMNWNSKIRYGVIHIECE